MRSKVVERRRNEQSYQSIMEESHRRYERAVGSSTMYSALISDYVKTFLTHDEIAEKLEWNVFQHTGLWNPTMIDIVRIEELLDTTLLDILNWGRQMGYNV